MAGVSTNTVARALNRTGPCSPHTRARIIEAAQAIGYPIRSTASVH
ncbi:helix-turn-helix domain-containing protein [Sphingomonas sp. MMS24-JH45]